MRRFPIVIISILLAACSTQVPSDFSSVAETPAIWPDYTDITVPSNIAPLNFRIDLAGDDYRTRLTSDRGQIVVKGEKVCMSVKEWRSLTESATDIKVEVFVRQEGKWRLYKPFLIHQAEPIDEYISYRLIPPSAVSYEQLTINQRNLTDFKEDVIYSNALIQKDRNGQCINCHHYRNYRTDNMQFHARQYKGGTVLILNGEKHKVNLKTDSTLSAGVYPAWHPTHDYIAYSTNQTKQSFHMTDRNHIEVLDLASDLILYDIKENSVSVIENDSDHFECFPAWAPDGKTLYYVSAFLPAEYSATRESELLNRYKSFHYDLYAKPFDPETRSWGPSRKIIDAAAMNKSITLPRVSPDGRYLMFTMGEYGVFHIWHTDADLYLLDLQNGQIRSASQINSNNVESYHSWSSNGKWVIFSTRRDDGGYTRLYISHFNGDGTFTKPFALPQEDPDFANQFMRSYNIPEFMIEPVNTTPHELAKFVDKNNAESVSYSGKREQAPN